LRRRPRILFCWELGGGLGHLYRILPLAAELAGRGCAVGCALPDAGRGTTRNAEEIPETLLTAPDWKQPARRFPPSLNYAQNLLRNGYWHSDSLRGQLRAWLLLLERFQPDLVIAEHAPTALLAARIAKVPRAAIGTGFSLPPLASPMPTLQPWFDLPLERLRAAEDELLDAVNPVLRTLGSPPLDRTADIFEGAHTFLCTLPEMDHYGPRANARYRGPVLHTRQDAPPAGLPADGRGFFLYLSPEHRHFDAILAAVRRTGDPALAFLPGLDEARTQALETERFRVTTMPVDLFAVAGACGAAITQGGHNATALLLLGGMPLFLCPSHLEQQLLAYRLQEQGLALTVNYMNPAPDFSSKLDTLASGRGPGSSARAFSDDHRWFDPSRQITSLVDDLVAVAEVAEGSASG